MGAMFRSEKMDLVQVFIQPEAAYFTISELGEAGVVQFKDLNGDINAFQRKFVNEVRRCDELERKLRFIESEVTKDLKIPDSAESPKAPNPRELIDLEVHIDKSEEDISELTESAVKLKSSFLEVTELKHVLEKVHVLFHEQTGAEAIENMRKQSLAFEELNVTDQLNFVTGVIKRERFHGFERMLWRVSRGNVFLKQADIETILEDPQTGAEMQKVVFVAFFQGPQLKSKVQKICAGYHATVYPVPSNEKDRDEMLKEVRTRIEDLTLVLNQNNDHRARVVNSVSKQLQNWNIMVCKMKAIYHTLNLFNVDVTKKCLIGECWVPTRDMSIVQKALAEGAKECGSSIPSFLNVITNGEDPPTYNKSNKFTQGFQNLIDSYGVASYREVNPALYTIITFPFLFAVMFGDLGHGFILILVGGYMVWKEAKIIALKSDSEMFNIFFAGRYIILLMGLFSFYTGIIYNDIFSKSMNIFGSSWYPNYNETFVMANGALEFHPGEDYMGEPYFMGMDPVWQLGTNKIIFLNSYKMKLSIIFGVVHMIFGVCVSVVNYCHFRTYAKILLEFLPQILLICFLFLYLVIMMFMKWIMFSAFNGDDISTGTACAPSVLIYFINMFLFKENAIEKGCKIYMFEFQKNLHMILVLASLICIPVLLLGTPLHEMYKRKHKKPVQMKVNGDLHNEEVEMEVNSILHPNSSHHEEEEEPISEIFIHQAIHTIEYVLSTISHTASYLRLWALSLAHAQLSEVLWTMLFRIGFQLKGYVGAPAIFVLFAPWAFLTIAILVTMEGLSAFLHTLRLHWVEFMSKFYIGLGYMFEPFSFKVILEGKEEEAT